MSSCKSHCAHCSCHFNSDEAFDKHRNGPANKRRCSAPERLSKLEPQTDDGSCSLTGKTIKKVTIWQVRPRP